MPLLPAPNKSLEEQIVALREGAGVRQLDDRVIAVRGSDRVSWLAGIVTNDTKSLTAGKSRYVAIVHEKGKILADAWVHMRADDILLLVPSATVDILVPHFERHIIMEDVEIGVLADASVVTVQGPRARDAIAPALHVFDSDRLGRGGVDVICERDNDSSPVLEAIASGAAIVVSEPAWEVARLEAGVPRFGVDFDGQNYVQEANITSRAVSFHKGCYVGQEVVCRLEMRGHVRRQLVSLVVDGDPPAAGSKIGEFGAITSSAYSPALGRSVALAMVKWDVATAGGSVDLSGRTADIVARPLP